MKKSISVLFVMVLALVMFFANTSGKVLAKTNPFAIKDGIAEGAWSAGTEVEINVDAAKYPDLQLLTKGVVVTQPTKICHEFRGGDYGWIADIRMLKNGVWVKQTTTTSWVPDTEGKLMTCTDASAAGTYALFGWYDAKSAEGKHINTPELIG